MTYAMSLNNVGFAELTHDEMLCVDGGWDAYSVVMTATKYVFIGACAGLGAAASGGNPVAGIAAGCAGAVVWNVLFE